MASTEVQTRPHDRHGRRRPFANWMKRLANLRGLHTDSGHNSSRATNASPKKHGISKNNPYTFSSRAEPSNNGHAAYATPIPSQRSRRSSIAHSKHSGSISHDSQVYQKSRAPTLATTAETTTSDAGRSGAGTSNTVARTEGDRDSTFSSPSPSLRSMTTTLTTIHSTVPPMNGVNHTGNANANAPVQTTTQPASALPAHLAPHVHPATYHSVTANNVLNDDASILTLASSSKRRRRNSLDTNASIKALAPASVFGGSRESLPLSVLSGTIIHGHNHVTADNASFRDTASAYYPRSASVMNAERASLISVSGVTAPALASERNSYIGSRPTGDGASVRSGFLGHSVLPDKERDREKLNNYERSIMHGRHDSIGGSSIGRERPAERESDRNGIRERTSISAPHGSGMG